MHTPARFTCAALLILCAVAGCAGNNSETTPSGEPSSPTSAAVPSPDVVSSTGTPGAPSASSQPKGSDSTEPSGTEVATSAGPRPTDSRTQPSAYTEEQLDYLVAVGLGSEYGGSPTVIKWLHDVRIKVDGDPTEEDRETLTGVIAELNTLISTVEVTLVDEDADINIHFVPLDDFGEYVTDYVEGNWGFFSYRFLDGGELESADIAIRSEGIDQVLRNHLIREELTQSFGLPQDSGTYPESIFYGDYSEVTQYAPMDEAIIEMLYRPEVEAGFSGEQIQAVLPVS